MHKNRTPDPETPMGGVSEPAAETEDALNPVYDAELTKEEIVLLATLGIRNPTTGEIVSIKMVAGILGRLLQKIREQAIEATTENKDSIELSRNAKEEYAWKIKVYMDAWKNPVAGMAIVENVNKELLSRYARAPRVIEK